MISGTTSFLLLSTEELDITLVDEVVFTLKGVGTVRKTYPVEVGFENNIFSVPLTQEDTAVLAGRIANTTVNVQAQINYKNKAVSKSVLKSFEVAQSLSTSYVEGNAPSEFQAEAITFDIVGEAIIANIDGKTKPEEIEAIAKDVIRKEDLASNTSVDEKIRTNVPSEVENYVTAHKDELKGDKGEQGIQGLKGDKGDKGPAGPKGEKGDTYTITESDYQAIADRVDVDTKVEDAIESKNLASKEYISNTLDNYATKEYADEHGGISQEELDSIVNPIKADLIEANKKIEFLDEMAQGQIYDFEEVEHSGMSVIPSGAKYESLLDARGKAEQTTYNGYQLLNVENGTYGDEFLTVTYKDGHMKVTGRVESSGHNFYDVLSNFSGSLFGMVEGEQYTLSLYNVVGNGLSSVCIVNNRNVTLTDSLIVNINNKVRTITAPKITMSAFRVYGVVDADIDVEFDVQLEKGSVGHTFEPYVGGIPSPNPLFPQRVVGVEELAFEVYKSKNLIHDMVTDSRKARFVYVLMTKTLKPSTTYTLSGITLPNASFYMGNLTNWQEVIADANGYFKATFKTIDNLDPIALSTVYRDGRWILLKNNVDQSDELFFENVQLELGSVATEYVEPQIETHKIIPPRPMYKIDEYFDKLNIADGVWEWNIDNDDFAFSYSKAENRYLCRKKISNSKFVYSEDFIFNKDAGNGGALGIRYSPEYSVIVAQATDEFMAENNNIETDVYFIRLETEILPINADDLEWLQTLQGIEPSTIMITDQNGNDVSFLVEYIVKLSERVGGQNE